MSRAVRFTISDLEGFPDPIDDTRYEVIDGELHVAKQPHLEHQYTTTVIAAELRAWSRQTGRGMALVGPGVIFSPEDGVAPDVVWISHERVAHGMRPDGHLYVAPELVVEVLSPGSANERRDRELKLKLYSREVVEEYWLIDRFARSVAVWRRVGDELQLADVLDDTRVLASPLLPEFGCPVRELWVPSA